MSRLIYEFNEFPERNCINSCGKRGTSQVVSTNSNNLSYMWIKKL